MALKPNFTVVYKVVGNCEIATDVYLPVVASEAVSTRPVIIDIHGGGFMLGYSDMVNKDQVQDCLDRGWIAVVPNHRLCPQVDIFSGPMQDIRDLLSWIYDGELDRVIAEKGSLVKSDLEKVVAFGTSAGGTLALSLGFGVKRRVAAILDFYGPCNFANTFWTSKLLPMADRIPKFPEEFLQQVYAEDPVPTKGGVSLEGQATQGPNFKDPRQAFAMTTIANGTLLDACVPDKKIEKIDAFMSVDEDFPPTCIVHGQSDTMVPLYLSKDLFGVLKSKGVESELVEVPGEEHTFAGKMVKGSETWNVQRRGFDFLESVLDRIGEGERT